jgi:hypothetical protein
MIVARPQNGRRRTAVRNRLAPLLILCAGAIAPASPLRAQTAPPTLQMVQPTGAHRGERVELTLRGTNIGDPIRLIFSEPGFTVRITGVTELPVEKMVTPKGVVRTDAPIDDKARKYDVNAIVTIAPTVPHGVHAFRLETPLGVSNLLRFAVSSVSETAEREPKEAGTAQPVTLPAALVGMLGAAGDVDAYTFAAKAGEEMVFQVVARPVGSRVDSVLKLLDAGGTVIAENNDFDLSRDSVLTWRAPASGRYTLTIEDVEHGGGKEGFGYRIYAGALPFVTGIFPIGVPRSGAEVVASGVNLGKAARIHVTADPSQPDAPSLLISPSIPGGHALNRKSAALGSHPEVLEGEPNDDRPVAQRLAVPSTVNGRIWTSNGAPADTGKRRADHDIFRFSARKGQTLVFDVTAQQLGSPLDSIIEVLDAEGRVVPRATIRCLARTEIALNDPDSTRRSMRLATWNELATNDYVLVGDELLQIQSMPTHPDDDLVFRNYRGMRVPLLDTSGRSHAVGDAVYKVEIHPAGTRLESNGMPVFQVDYVNDDGGSRFGGKDSRLHFEAPADGDYFVRISDVRGLEGERFAYRLGVREPTPGFDLTFEPRSFNIPRGGRVSVTVTADRVDGFDGPIDVELRSLPRGLTATTGQIPPGSATTVLMVAAADTASFEAQKAALPSMYRADARYEVPGVAALTLVGRATIDGRIVTREAQSTEPLSIVALAPQPDLTVTTHTQRIEVPAGQEIALTVTVERHNGFTGRIPIAVLNLPHGVRVNDVGLNGVMITEQETTRTIHIIAEPWVQPQTQPILVVGRVEVNSPLRNEAAALPVELAVTGPRTTVSR